MNSGRRSVLNHGILVQTDLAAFENGHVPQGYLPAVLRGVKCYDPSELGHQKAITERNRAVGEANGVLQVRRGFMVS